MTRASRAHSLSAEAIRLMTETSVRLSLSLSNVGDLLAERAIEIC
jgi:hypothetical protein